MTDVIAGAASASPAGNNPRTGRSTPSDYETFLKMLTTQLENQDPLAPVESQDLAVQLATFSGVEQQTLTNDLLAQLTEALGASNMSDLSDWIGREVLTDKPVSFSGSPLKLEFDVPDQATAAEVVVFDENDREVQRIAIPLESTSITWDGTVNSGQAVPAGNYRFEVLGNVDGAPLPAEKARAFGEVAEVRRTDGEIVLRLSGGVEVPAEEVLGFR